MYQFKYNNVTNITFVFNHISTKKNCGCCLPFWDPIYPIYLILFVIIDNNVIILFVFLALPIIKHNMEHAHVHVMLLIFVHYIDVYAYKIWPLC